MKTSERKRAYQKEYMKKYIADPEHRAKMRDRQKEWIRQKRAEQKLAISK